MAGKVKSSKAEPSLSNRMPDPAARSVPGLWHPLPGGSSRSKGCQRLRPVPKSDTAVSPRLQLPLFDSGRWTPTFVLLGEGISDLSGSQPRFMSTCGHEIRTRRLSPHFSEGCSRSCFAERMERSLRAAQPSSRPANLAQPPRSHAASGSGRPAQRQGPARQPGRDLGGLELRGQRSVEQIRLQAAGETPESGFPDSEPTLLPASVFPPPLILSCWLRQSPVA